MIFDLSKDVDQLTARQKIKLGISLIEEAVKKGGCDLHLHTQASDGAENAARIVQKAIENKLLCFSVTDHDSISGVGDVIRILYKLKSIGMNCPRFVPGIELSVQEDREIHMLGYFPFGGYEKMESFLLIQRERRNKRNVEMCRLLTEHGMPVSIDELKSEGGEVVGRLHAANVMIRKGLVGSTKEAFNNWLSEGKPGYAPRSKSTSEEAIAWITDAGGIPVIAHPYLYGWTSGLKTVSPLMIKRLEDLKRQGLLGVEAFHGEATFAQKLETEAAAKTLDLFCTAGSDYHGNNKPEVAMYDGTARFFHENDSIYIAAILEHDNKVMVVKKTQGLNAGKWHLPSGRKPADKEAKDFLKDIMMQTWNIHVTVKEHYVTTFYDDPHQRVTLITYMCDFDMEKVIEKCTADENLGFLSLGVLAGMNLLLPDATVIDKLREITFI
ncbi:MAG: PHP domain-containing protein [Saccharofermentanales bacterium]